MRISDWSSDVCSSDLSWRGRRGSDSRWLWHCCRNGGRLFGLCHRLFGDGPLRGCIFATLASLHRRGTGLQTKPMRLADHSITADSAQLIGNLTGGHAFRSEEHTSELQSLMRISYAVFCFKKKNKNDY